MAFNAFRCSTVPTRMKTVAVATSVWKMLTEVKNDRSMRDENEQEYRFRVKDAAAYRYYKFEFEKVWEDTRIQLSEIKLYK